VCVRERERERERESVQPGLALGAEPASGRELLALVGAEVLLEERDIRGDQPPRVIAVQVLAAAPQVSVFVLWY
jgi:hypothetical protein